MSLNTKVDVPCSTVGGIPNANNKNRWIIKDKYLSNQKQIERTQDKQLTQVLPVELFIELQIILML